jgi:hypothetical protein
MTGVLITLNFLAWATWLIVAIILAPVALRAALRPELFDPFFALLWGLCILTDLYTLRLLTYYDPFETRVEGAFRIAVQLFSILLAIATLFVYQVYERRSHGAE